MQPAERILVVVDPGAPMAPALRAARLVSPKAQLTIAALFDSRSHEDVGAVELLLDSAQCVSLAQRSRCELVVVGPWPSRSARSRARWLLELSRAGLDVLSIGARCAHDEAPSGVIGVAFNDLKGLSTLAEVLESLPHGARVVAFTPHDAEALVEALTALLPGMQVEQCALDWSLAAPSTLDDEATRRRVDLVLVSLEGTTGLLAVATGLLAAAALENSSRPVFIAHARASDTRLRDASLTASDTVRLEGSASPVLVELTGPAGRLLLDADQRVRRGTNETLPHLDGVIRLTFPTSRERLLPVALSLDHGPHPALCHAIDGRRALVLVDAAVSVRLLGELEPLVGRHELVFVRLRDDEPLTATRARLSELPWGGQALLLDATAWLDDEGGHDLPRSVDSQRLVRVGTRLRALGARVDGVVVTTEQTLTAAFTIFTPATLAARIVTHVDAPPTTDPLTELTHAKVVDGNQVYVEWDNGAARRAIIDGAAQARARIHLQAYIFEDDAVVEQVCAALEAAASRGVKVRVLADALYSLHDAFGASNDVLSRLARRGVEVRAWSPLTGAPDLAALKLRNHRKVITFDNEVAWLSGRNLGAVYYAGVDEALITPTVHYGAVPWLDASVRIEGPLVAHVERAFLSDWVRAGGSHFQVNARPACGDVKARLVLHDGLADTHTLEAQRALIDSARSRLVVVNNFPLVLELQRALINAVARGVRVQLLFGNVRPRWGEHQPFEGGVLRGLGDELVRSRLEPVLRAGAEGWEYRVPLRPAWDPRLGQVFPHVHAKVLVRDETDVAIGSANLDATSAYWENEALLLVHDARVASTVVATIERLIATSRRADVAQADWSDQHARREWLGQHWPSLLG